MEPQSVVASAATSIGRRILRGVSYGVGGLLALLLLLAVVGALYNAVAMARDERRFPPPGRLIEVDGVQLHLYCTGTGSPTVVLDAGLGISSVEWALVQPELARSSRVCSYDRAGSGWSAPTPGPRTSSAIAEQLHQLLERSGTPGPYVLVGHSFGGYNMRVFADRYQAAGLVLVDSSHEDQNDRLPPALRLSPEKMKPLVRVGRVLLRLGLMRVLPYVAGIKESSPVLAKLSPQTRAELRFLSLQDKVLDANLAEIEAFAQSAREVRAVASLGALPLVVLTAGRDPEYLKPEVAREFHQVWVSELQPALARLSSRGRQVVLPDSGHMIPLERPDAVVAAVREVIAQGAAPAGN